MAVVVEQCRCLFICRSPLKALLTLHAGSLSAVRNALRNSIILIHHVGTCRHVHSQVETCKVLYWILPKQEQKAQTNELQLQLAVASITKMVEHGCKHQKGPGFASPLVRDMQIVQT